MRFLTFCLILNVLSCGIRASDSEGGLPNYRQLVEKAANTANFEPLRQILIVFPEHRYIIKMAIEFYRERGAVSASAKGQEALYDFYESLGE